MNIKNVPFGWKYNLISHLIPIAWVILLHVNEEL